MRRKGKLIWVSLIVFSVACGPSERKSEPTDNSFPKDTYGYDAAFLRQYDHGIIELKNKSGSARILVSSKYQGRVMTSTAGGDGGTSYGWINYDLISSTKWKEQFNPVGGEERFWLGPEGGQYSLYFHKGDSFSIENWRVPGVIDTVRYTLTGRSDSSAIFSTDATLINYSGTRFEIAIRRTVALLDRSSLFEKYDLNIPESIDAVVYETTNTIQNNGIADWKKETGLMSVWLLGMMKPTDKTVVIIPFKPLENFRTYITDDYFDKIPDDRLIVKDSALYFRCDGKLRSKIGLSPKVAKPIAASFDFEKNILTLILFEIDLAGDYVNSTWKIQDAPYRGDVVNAYNDGPLEKGEQLGPFYELESSSAAVELKKGQIQSYRQTTCHLEGKYEDLQKLTIQLLGLDLDEVENSMFGQ